MSNTNIYTLSQIQEILNPIFKQNKIKKAVIFGSYVKGTASENSDIDIMVDSGFHGLRFVNFLGEICDALQKEVDLIDISHIEPNSKIEDEISKTGVTVYEE